MSKRFLIIMAVLVVGFIGIIIVSGKKDDSSKSTGDSTSSNHIKGEGASGVALIEYGDFQCPSCSSYYPVIKEVAQKYEKQITVQFKHFPLVQIHQNAMIAHRAAEAAGNQDKFWGMHDLLYERQQAWSQATDATQIVEDYATELALNIDKFREDFASPSVNDIIQADTKLGQDQGVSGTPSFILNGEKIEESPRDLEGFSKLIDEAIAKQSQ